MMDSHPWMDLLAIDDPCECYNKFSIYLHLMFDAKHIVDTPINISLDVNKPLKKYEKNHNLQRLFHKN